MKLLVVLCLVTATASATPWQVDPGPKLLAIGRGALRSATLDDGRVIVDAGFLPMLFEGGTWSWLGEKKVFAAGPTVAIPGGLLVASGGVVGEKHGALVWEAKTDHWRPSGGLIVERDYQHTEMAAVLADGSVLVVGGTQSNNHVLASAERWTAKAHAFVAAGELQSPRYDGTLTALRDGRALVAGGADDYGNGPVTAACELYDPKTNAWTTVPNMHVARRGHTATLLPDGRVLVAGGKNHHENAIAELEIFDPKTTTWTVVAKLGEARVRHAAVLLPRGRVMFIGGVRDDDKRAENGSTVVSAETYDVAANSFDVFYPPHGYWKPVVARLADDRLLVAGGFDFYRPVDRVELWTPNAGHDAPWKLVAPVPPPVALPKGMATGTLTTLADGSTLAIGGSVWTEPEAQRFDPATHAWSHVTMASARVAHVAVALPDGHVLIAGGVGPHPARARILESVPPAPAVRSAELFDPKTTTFKHTGAPSVRREDAAATLLADGRVLLCGGDDASCEAWGPKLQRFTRSPPMHVARKAFTLTTLSSGRVVAIGGDAIGTYEVYDPAQRVWSEARQLPEPWRGHTAEALPGDRVRVTIRDRAYELAVE